MRAVSTAASAVRHSMVAVAEALVVAAIIAALLLALSPAYEPADFLAGTGSAQAAKGGNGKGHGAQAVNGTAWVSASPSDPAAWGSRVDINGCGYAFAPVELRVVHSAGNTEAYMVGVWANGCMAGTYITTQEPGVYTVQVFQSSGSRGHQTNLLVASTDVSVN